MEVGTSSSALEAEDVRGFELTGSSAVVLDPWRGEECEPIQESDDSQLAVDTVEVAGGSVVDGEESQATVALEVKHVFELGESVGEKRKRGRPPRGQGKPPPPKRIKEEEEDVCFICFDGGSLVLCDRKGCPKAYHPSCIKRDEAFFRSKAKWNCGWHICSVCQKAAHYMCYTCTYSLCKVCTKHADYGCVRGNKGFCATCMRTIMMIENKEKGSEEMDQVDFDDKSSWEYLFKVYWIYLKEKLSLTFDELTQAKNPWKGGGKVARKEASSNFYTGSDECKAFMLDSSVGDQELSNSKRSKTEERPEFTRKDPLSTVEQDTDLPPILDDTEMRETVSAKGLSLDGNTEWASKELLELVAYMKNGDASILSQYDVQALLLDYIKRNNLRDPNRKSQIVCDSRLKNLFGKHRVGHFEMLKLLEFHFLIKDDYQRNLVPAGLVNYAASQVEPDLINGKFSMVAKDKRRKTRKMHDRVLQTNLGEYAAIDVHNIKLIYLHRSLMETIVEDTDDFYNEVVGSIVRIRISCSDHKQEIYRLVQVVGTCKVPVPYKIGNKTANIKLEVLNLDKKEAVSIDSISNHEFTEDECRRLRQSIKCGLVKHFTVGEIQKKAMVLQAVRLSDWLETEILRLNHLRDRANEKGHKKELRECVHKLELLKSPEERQRRLHEIPEVHVDPNMDPNYESEEDSGDKDYKKEDVKGRSLHSKFGRRGSKQISKHDADKTEGSIRALKKVNEDKYAQRSNLSERSHNQVDSGNLSLDCWNKEAAVRSGSCSLLGIETSTTPVSTGHLRSAINSDRNKIWHYRDPQGKVQGPFARFQLQKWSTTGLFPPDMKIWTCNEQKDSILLTNALNGQFSRPLLSTHICVETKEDVSASVDRLCGTDPGSSKTTNDTRKNGVDGIRLHGDARIHSKGEHVSANRSSSHSSTRIIFAANYEEQASTLGVSDFNKGAASCTQQGDSLKGKNANLDMVVVHSPFPSSAISEQSNITIAQDDRGHEDESSKNSDQNVSSGCLSTIKCNNENRSDCQGNSNHSSGQNWKSLPTNFCPSNSELNSDFATLTKSTDSSRWKGGADTTDLPSPTPKSCNDWDIEVGAGKKSVKPVASVQDSYAFNLPSPTPKPDNEDQNAEKTVSKQSAVFNIPGQDSGPSWGSASSLVVDGAQLLETADEWGVCSPCTAKPNVEEWDSCLASSLKGTEVLSDHVGTPTSESDQFSHPSPSQLTSNLGNWSGPIEFSTLAEESVSDLLAEVDAMESRGSLASPTSAMNCSDDLFQDSRHECLCSIDELSPPETGKSDALSSTGDIQLPSQPNGTDNPARTILKVDSIDHTKRLRVQFQKSAELEEESQSSDVLANHFRAHSEAELPISFSMGRDMFHKNTDQNMGSEATDTNRQARQEHVNFCTGIAAQGIANMVWQIGQGQPRGSGDMNSSFVAGASTWESQKRHAGERYVGSGGWASQCGDSGFSRSRHSWGRQLYSSSSVETGASSRPPPKGRVCKFYESGHCKKGAMCDYLHR